MVYSLSTLPSVLMVGTIIVSINVKFSKRNPFIAGLTESWLLSFSLNPVMPQKPLTVLKSKKPKTRQIKSSQVNDKSTQTTANQSNNWSLGFFSIYIGFLFSTHMVAHILLVRIQCPIATLPVSTQLPWFLGTPRGPINIWISCRLVS
jgi:hypothetical protein